MTKDSLYGCLADPTKVEHESLDELRTLAMTYPYSATCVYLYLYKAATESDVCFSVELGRFAPLLPSRAKLFHQVAPFVGGKIYEQALIVEATEETTDSFAVIEEFLSEMKAAGADLPDEITYTHSMVPDYLDRGGVVSFASSLSQKNSESSAAVFSQFTSPSVGAFYESLDEKTETMDVNEINVEDSLFTETLAKIYIKQGHYEKALRIVKSLSLKFPEKSLYFADRIRFLEKIIKNNKQE